MTRKERIKQMLTRVTPCSYMWTISAGASLAQYCFTKLMGMEYMNHAAKVSLFWYDHRELWNAIYLKHMGFRLEDYETYMIAVKQEMEELL